MSVLGLVFTAAALLVALYGANALLLSVLYLRLPGARSKQRRPAGSAAPARDAHDWPVVTVQLPIYNEALVVKRLIDAVAGLDYPRQCLQIQVLDDSTDETTALARARVAFHSARGLPIELIHRDDQRDYKAGALAHGLETARGRFVALFDADFVPPAGFLKCTVPHLEEDPRLAFVQARWGHLNPDTSLLTRAQTLALDGHFVVDHLGRNRNGLLINFNGTAGVWRREAIDDAGGWQGDTLTEDVDLSFRAQLAGWRALYLPDVEVPAELPPQLAAFRRQQGRWATGAAQCLVKLGGALVRGTRGRLSWAARLEGLLHLSTWVAHPMSLLLLLLTPLMLLGRIGLAANLTLFWAMALGPIFAIALSQRHLHRDWVRRMRAMPALALIGTGLALSNTLTIARGLLRRDVAFRRTPKYQIVRRGQCWAGTRYALPFQWVTVGELALAAYSLASAALAISMGHYFSVPFLLLYAAGYGTMALHGLRDAWLGWRTHPRPSPRPVLAESESK